MNGIFIVPEKFMEIKRSIGKFSGYKQKVMREEAENIFLPLTSVLIYLSEYYGRDRADYGIAIGRECFRAITKCTKFQRIYKSISKAYPKYLRIKAPYRSVVRGVSFASRYHFYNPSGSYYVLNDEETKIANEMLAKFCEYQSEHHTEVPGELKDISEMYYKYGVDMNLADAICKKQYGVSFSDIEGLKKSDDIVSLSPAMRKVLIDYTLLVNYNSGKYHVSYKNGRLYTPFHNISKIYRKAFIHKGSGEKDVEVMDMKGAFVGSTWTQVTYVCEKLGMTKEGNAAVKAMEDCFVNGVDPYSFAISDVCDRSTAKKITLRYLFSNMSHIRHRRSIYKRLEKAGKIEEARHYCEEFYKFVDSISGVFYLNDDTLNTLFDKYRNQSTLFYYLSGKYVKNYKCTFTNDLVKKESKLIHFKSFYKKVMYVYTSIMQNEVEVGIIKHYGKEALDGLLTTVSLYDYMTKLTRANALKDVKRYAQKYGYDDVCSDVFYKLSVNSSIFCQLAEGDAMFSHILPALQEKFQNGSFHTLHDAIFCRESIARKIDTKKLRQDVNKQVMYSVINVLSNDTFLNNSIKNFRNTTLKAA